MTKLVLPRETGEGDGPKLAFASVGWWRRRVARWPKRLVNRVLTSPLLWYPRPIAAGQVRRAVPLLIDVQDDARICSDPGSRHLGRRGECALAVRAAARTPRRHPAGSIADQSRGR